MNCTISPTNTKPKSKAYKLIGNKIERGFMYVEKWLGKRIIRISRTIASKN